MPTSCLLLYNAAICWQKLECHYTIVLVFPLINHNDKILNTHKVSLNCLQDSPSVFRREGYNLYPMSGLGTLFNKPIKRAISRNQRKEMTQYDYIGKKEREIQQRP